ncbi:MAG: phenylphosphate carboxylase subunit gamma [Deltaproteobacteria bacterium]|nr:phenylphosphate carboxylase subunit gamma [Deltaproteobacteria bacterium]
MEYLTFVKDLDELLEVKEINMVIKDLTPGIRKYEARYVSARVTKSLDASDDKLWVRFEKGLLHPEPLGIKIIKELGAYPT